MVAILPRRRVRPAIVIPPQPDVAAVAVFPVLGTGIYLVPHGPLLGPAVWSVFSILVSPREYADAEMRHLGIANPQLTQGTPGPTLVSYGDRLLAVTAFFTPARQLLESVELPGHRRVGEYDLQLLLQSGALMPETAGLLPAIKNWSRAKA
ncbi:MAG TPA: hypothetical protein VGH44_01405 [Candidatus Saccharimonadia bacterium]|jgi:hypothetical protein